MEGSKHSKLLNKSVVIAFFLIKGRKVKHVEHNTNESGWPGLDRTALVNRYNVSPYLFIGFHV